MNNNSKTYFRNLDAPRFFAFLVVFLEHIVFTKNPAILNSAAYRFYIQHFSQTGVVGWDFYMVLSGFLITWIILEEYSSSNKFSLPYFWLRRILRTWPLYFLMIAAGLALTWIALHYYGRNINGVPPLSWLLSFTLNFYIIGHGQAFLFFLVFFWSISVEEQCYLVWGIVLKWVRKAFVPICMALIIGSLIFRIYAIHDLQNLYFNSLSWVGNFAAGGLLAWLCINRKQWLEKLRNIPLWLSGFVYLLFIINLAFYKSIYSSDFMTIIERLCAIMFLTFIIFEQSFSNKHLFQFGSMPFLSYLGKISYGLFCYHGLVILAYGQLTKNSDLINSPIFVFLINPLIIFALTVGIASLSYEYFEKPIMRLRRKFQSI